jgi:hypothetical protein
MSYCRQGEQIYKEAIVSYLITITDPSIIKVSSTVQEKDGNHIIKAIRQYFETPYSNDGTNACYNGL